MLLSTRLISQYGFMIAGGLLAFAAHAQPSNIDFSHEDWQVVCDNTRTCRIAGYSALDSDMPVSVLLTREAGRDTAISGEVKVGRYDTSSAASADDQPSQLVINGTDYGALGELNAQTGALRLSDKQVQALIDALAGNSRIEFTASNQRWLLSDQGAAAVLLKADEAQGRLHTTTAFIRRGPHSQSSLAALAMPVVYKVAPVNRETTASVAGLSDEQLREALLSSVHDDRCSALSRENDDGVDWQIYQLDDKRFLVSHLCWSAAYNFGYGMWLINREAPYQPSLITTQASDYGDGEITAAHKGRGLGDCYATTQWTWTGDDFVKSYEGSTGMCRLIEAGGAWELPTYVTEVRSRE